MCDDVVRGELPSLIEAALRVASCIYPIEVAYGRFG